MSEEPKKGGVRIHYLSLYWTSYFVLIRELPIFLFAWDIQYKFSICVHLIWLNVEFKWINCVEFWKNNCWVWFDKTLSYRKIKVEFRKNKRWVSENQVLSFGKLNVEFGLKKRWVCLNNGIYYHIKKSLFRTCG